MARNKQIEAAEKAWAASAQVVRDAINYRTVEDKVQDERIRLYFTHKSHGSLWVYYMLYRDEYSKMLRTCSAQIADQRER